VRFRAQTIDADIPWLGHERDDVILFRSGGIFVMYELQGVRFETLEDILITERKLRLNHTYCQIAHDAITLTIWQHRGPANPSIYPDVPTDTPFAGALNLAYKAHLLDQTLYDNRIFLGIQVRPPAYKKAQYELLRFHRPVAQADQDQLRQLDDLLRLLENELRAYQPRRLGVRLQNRTTFSEIAETVVWLTTGVWRPIGLTTGLLGEAMFSEHIEVGWDSLKFIAPGGVRFAVMLGIQLYPAETHPFMLTRLLVSSYQCTIRHSFRFVPTTAALEIIQRKNFFMTKANDPAKSQVASLQYLADDISSGRVVMGDHSSSVLVFADTEQALERTAAVAWTDFAESGAKIVRETLALKAALLAAIPGNEHLQPRGGYMTSKNQASFAPMFAYPPGPERGHWGAPIAVFRSPAGTVIRFHWQYLDDAGNTLVTGETGSGKSLLVGFLMALTTGRAKVIALDHKRGWNLLIRALRGRYTVLGTGEPMFNPLKALTDTPSDIAFMTDLCRGCILSDHGSELRPDQDRRLALGIRMVMSLPPEDRSLWEIRAFLGTDPNGPGARLEKWCSGKELGWVLDAPDDALSLTGRLHGLDTTSLLNNVRARGPALFYLFHRISKELDGSPTLITVDEGWRVLLDDVFGLLVEIQIRTIRSKNGVFVFITQGAGEIRNARFANVLVEQCSTQIHLPNPRATEDDYVNGLKRTRGEFEMLRKLPKGSGLFLLCQGADAMVAQLPLRGLDDFIAVLSGRESTLRLFDQALTETGGDVEQALLLFHASRQAEPTL